ncbi:MAG: sulfite exporter TauE/SafE family protein [Pseudomonadota bacterium]
MNAAALAAWIQAGLEPAALVVLIGASFLGSFITAAFGIGGGAFLLAVMASLLPPLALIPVHGVIQLGSNALRLAVMIAYVHWPPVAAFTAGTLLGVALGGSVAVALPPGLVLIGVGLFVLWNVLGRAPRWLVRWPALIGAVTSCLTMFFGATGLFVASYTKSLNLPRRAHVASHAAFMTAQHLLKVVAFGLLGVAFGPWLGFIAAMTLAGFAGTLAGRLVLARVSDRAFRRVLDAILILLSLRLIWVGLAEFV